MSVPSETLLATTDRIPTDKQQEILDAFHGNTQPVTSPASYRLGILLVAVVMVLLPLIYLALIGLVGYAVYYHAIHDTWIFQMAQGGRAMLTAFVIYSAPMVIGPILIVFMFKPLFSRPVDRSKQRSLGRDQEPLLFAFVERVCEAVRAPKPRRIDMDCRVNASASFRRGLWSMLGNDLVLTVGVPLVAGMNLRQFAGVLAHEFGHFSQGAGMRLTYLIRSISFWFTRVVYERDEWDQKLVEWSGAVDLRVGWILYVARFFVWLTRKVLWVLMMLGHVVSGYMLRQMELDADRHEARLAGSDTFEATARRLAVLHFANQNAQEDLGRFYQEGRLADDLPRLIMANVDQFPADVLTKIDQVVDQSATGWLDTHPSDRERIASARSENAAGIFRLEEPAAVLFSDFERTAREVTGDFYHEIFGDALKREDIHPVQELLARQGQETESYKALRRYFQDIFSPLRALALSNWTIAPPDDPGQKTIELKQAREQMLAELPKYREAYTRFDEVDTGLLHAEQAEALLRGGLKVGKSDFPMPLTSTPEVAMARIALAHEQKETEDGLAALEAIAAKRLLRALELLGAPPVADRVENLAERQTECQALLKALSVVEAQVGPLTRIRNALASLSALFGQLEGRENKEALVKEIRSRLAGIEQQVRDVRKKLSTTAYPFDHAKKEISIGEYVLATAPDAGNPGELARAADALVRTVTQLRARLIGRLCQIAEIVESHLGLEPLAEPPASKGATS